MEEKIIKEYNSTMKLVDYKGQNILFLDFSNLESSEEVVKLVGEARKIVDSFPQDKSLLMLTDFTNLRYNKDSLQSAKDFAKKNVPYMKKSAIVGIKGLLSVAAKGMITFSGRENIYPFDTKEEAFEWLIK